ncbi:uncharacterized protein BDW70DRAFT_165155 [Aspergillus foveolatus]|uniref:uncharacterized protein n=1 Tax=Aspergillus foveolatus TaxID=210207 RepID=UPI003CCD2E8E
MLVRSSMELRCVDEDPCGHPQRGSVLGSNGADVPQPRYDMDSICYLISADMPQSTWDIAAPFGRLVEIGKGDIYKNFKSDVDPFHKNLAYAAVDIDLIGFLNKLLLGCLLRESFGLVLTGKIKPLYPITKVAFSDAQTAFRMLQIGADMGKVILVPGADDIVPVLLPTYNTNKLLSNTAKTYLIVGGLGGIGRRLSE